MSKKIAATPPPIEANPRPFVYRDRLLHCDGADLTTLAAEHGTPLYVYSARHISHRLQLFKDAFAAHPHTICYAIKANSSLAILRLLAKQGAGFDIVSGGELERVRKAHKPALKKVVFSGVGKQTWEIDAALDADILLFNVESEAELHLLAARAEARSKVARFALRVNPDVFAETHPYISTGLSEHKFGIDIKAARSIYRSAKKMKWLDPAGVSVHIGSQIRKVDPFAAALTRVTSLIADLRRDGHNIRYIDAGGGLGIDYGTTAFDPAKQVAKYAAALTKGLGTESAHLLLEPGRFIIAQAGALLTRVLYVKKNGTKTFVITDAGMNDLIRPALYHAHHEIIPIKEPAKQPAGKQPLPETGENKVDVVGPVCESGDFFARDRVLPPVKPNDLLLLLDAGAYGMSQTSNYNSRPRPAELLIDGATTKLIRRRETMRDLLAPELL
ncbi:diaminopimelate decarboxylase [Tunturibacter empetritectus]|uniref:Diaminopimelate decarboxylase n=1 Tax=Tunturiibacter empetritectus TaxID=3069691 RepID=A0A7W8IEF4_9BACT|nr:diaminopimelate decarboxylase [Edaphobacter lichenicola]MBB5315669.1 diaminopimelate decarboxylase [Edaphobacter lichenicola]